MALKVHQLYLRRTVTRLMGFGYIVRNLTKVFGYTGAVRKEKSKKLFKLITTQYVSPSFIYKFPLLHMMFVN